MFGFSHKHEPAKDSQHNTAFDEYDFSVALRDIENSLGSVPRNFSKKDHLKPPFWMNSPDGDDLFILILENRKIFETGQVVWGAVVQANERIFKRGIMNYCGNLIYSLEPHMNVTPNCLEDIAEDLYEIKGEQCNHSVIQQISDTLEDELERLMKIKLPKEHTNSFECFFTSCLFDRKHLKNGHLEYQVVPILAHTDRVSTMVVPHWYWPQSLFPMLED